MYDARITREHRSAVVILCDMSGSMAEEITFRGRQLSKANAVARILNELLDEFINRCRRHDGVRDYFDIAVLGYSGEGVTSLLSRQGEFTSTEQLIRKPVRSEQETILRRLPSGNQVSASVTVRYWIEPKASGDTPMGAALSEAEKLVGEWSAKSANRQSFPPVVINITDGEASDSDARQLCAIAEKIRTTGTADGNTLFFNVHLADTDNEDAVTFPSSALDLPANRYARVLYDMSSEVPECYNETIMQLRRNSQPPFRAMSFNCDINELFSMLAIGSLSISLTA